MSVTQYDDGSQPGMHDLNVLDPRGDVMAAVEVTAAADAASIELWNIVNGGDTWIVPDLDGGWMIAFKPTARAKRIRAELPDLLREYERAGVMAFAGERWSGRGEVHEPRAATLGIVHAGQYGTAHPGSVYMTIEQPSEQTGGAVSSAPRSVAPWVGDFLRDPSRRDVLSKLGTSGSHERHAFIILPGFSTAPYGVAELLWQEESGPFPESDPELPSEVTHVWLVSTLTVGSGLRWSPDAGWRRFLKELA